MKENEYIFVTEFNDRSMRDFYNKFMELEAADHVSVIPVYISSYGGEVYSLIAMRDIIKSSTKPVMTVVLGKAFSCGILLSAAGTKGLRFISPDSELMIHEVSSWTSGTTTTIQHDAKGIAELNEKVMRNLANDSGISYERIRKELNSRNNNDWYISSNEAVKLGFADIVAIPRQSVEAPKVKIDIKLTPPAKKAKKKVAKNKKSR